MYTWFYGFSEEPFNVNPEPKFLLLTETHRQALDSMVEGIKERRGFIAILGELGSGKSTLIQHLLNTIDKKVKAVAVFHPPSSVQELMEDTLRELGVPPISKDKVSLVGQLNDFLHRLTPEETLAVILDEAQDLRREVMEELCLLPTLGMLSAQKLQILFVGQSELKAKLDSANLKELKQKVEVVSQIRPLNDEECQQYIAHRLRMVGSDITKVITPEAVSLICQYCRGNPRTINVLCDNAFLIGYGLSKKKVDSDMVTEVLEDLNFVGQEKFPGWQAQERGTFRAPSRKGKSPLFRKISYSLLTLVGVGAIIFLGRIFLKGPEEQPATRFPIQPPTAREKVVLAPSEARPDLAAKAVPRPDADLKPPAPAEPERKPSAPPAAQEGKLSVPPAPVQQKPTAPAPEARPSISPPPPPPTSQASLGKTKAETPVKKVVVVKAGDSIYTIAAKAYKVANTSVVDQILESNPKIANPNKLLANQEIRLPEITEESLVIKSSDGTCKIRLGTFLKPEYAAFLKAQPALQGKQIEIIPRKFLSGETWYRAMAGTFSTREEGLKAIHDLKKKGLSPYFAGYKKNK